jgi:small conductance mechanosensitive channel
MITSYRPLFSLGDVLQRIAEILRIDAGEVARGGARVLGVWILAFLGYRLIGLLARRIERSVDDHDDAITTTRERRGQTIAQLLRSMGRVVIVAVAVLLTFNVFIDIGPILAGAGILGLAVSFGAQSLVKDVISGFFILFENQFGLGDVIEVAGKSGTVEKMTLRVVVLRDVYGVMHVIPNSEIKVVSNKTRGWSRAVVDVSVGRDVDVDQALGVVRDEANRFSNDPKWKPELDGAVEVLGVESVSDNSVVIRSLIRTRPGSQWSVGREFRRRMKARLYHEEIEIPYPARPPHGKRDKSATVQIATQPAPPPPAPDEAGAGSSHG